MLVFRAIIGGVFLFLGRELNFFFAAAMAALIGLRLTPLLPQQWPSWSDYAFMIGLAVLAAVIVSRKERAGFAVSGFLVGGYILVEYFEPGVLTLPLVPFLLGGAIGALVIGVFTEWALIIISCLVGSYFLTSMFTLTPTAQLMVGAGLFIIGALTQVLMMRMAKND